MGILPTSSSWAAPNPGPFMPSPSATQACFFSFVESPSSCPLSAGDSGYVVWAKGRQGEGRAIDSEPYMQGQAGEAAMIEEGSEGEERRWDRRGM